MNVNPAKAIPMPVIALDIYAFFLVFSNMGWALSNFLAFSELSEDFSISKFICNFFFRFIGDFLDLLGKN